VLDVVTLYPFLLHVMARPGSDATDREAIAGMLESYFVRRVACGLNTRGYGTAFLGWIRRVAELGPDGLAAPTLRAILPVRPDDTLRWPSDAEFQEALVGRSLYGTIRRERLVLVLTALEEHRRAQSAKTPQVPLGDLQIEHIMPQAWHANWPLDPTDPEAAEKRGQFVNTLGNLTLATGPLNLAMSNAPWVHANPKLCKRCALDEHDVLFLNRDIVKEGDGMRAVWSEASITARAKALAARAVMVWPGPPPA
jgi:hypothetical protein